MDRSRGLLVLVATLAVVLLALTSVPVGVVVAQQVVGAPDVEVYSPDNRLVPGQEATLPVYVENSGDVRNAGPAEHVQRVTTARGASIEVLEGDAPVSVTTGRYPVGTIPQGTQGPFEISIAVAADAEPGTYELPVRVRYDYTRIVSYGDGDVEYRDNDYDRTHDLTVRILEGARFRIVETDATAQIGGRGNVSVTVRNVGTDAARDASVQLSTGSDEVSLGTQSGASRAFVGEWEPGTNRTFTFATRVATDAVRREYPITAQVTYDDADGIRRMSAELTTGFVPRPEQTFAVDDLAARLYADETGTVEGTVRNTGPDPVRNAVLVFGHVSEHVTPVEPETSLGRLAPGESAPFSLEVDVADAASAGDRQLNLTVRYRDAGGDRRSSATIEPTVTVAAGRDRLAVAADESTLEIDTDNRLVVSVRNTGAEPLRNLRLGLQASDPFSSEASTSFVERLAPNETATVAFGVTVSDDAVATQSAVTLNATAERADGRRVDAGSYAVPVTVVEGSGPGSTTLFVGLALVVAVLLGGGWWWLRR